MPDHPPSPRTGWPAAAPVLAALALMSSGPASAAEKEITPELARKLGYIDVTQPPYNARPDDGRDDTPAIQAAIIGTPGYRTIYFPAGTYDVCDTISWRTGNASDYFYDAGISFQGQSRSRTVLKLVDGCPGYGDPDRPKAVIYAASGWRSLKLHPTGGGADAFINNLRDLTVDTGVGNPGAVAADYICTNMGGIENVTVKSSDPQHVGVAGISMNRGLPGPCLLKDVEVVGFDYGIHVPHHWDYGNTFENITLRSQRQAGVIVENNSLYFHRVRSDQSAHGAAGVKVGFQKDGKPGGMAQVVLVDARFTGGRDTGYAVEVPPGDAQLYARDLTADGYKGPLLCRGREEAGPRVAEFFSARPAHAPDGPPRMLHLPIRDTPTFWDNDPANWAFITDPPFKATPDDMADDDGPAIQAAIDSGKPVVALPRGTFHVRSPVVVRGKARLLFGTTSTVLRIAPGHTFTDDDKPRPMVRFENDRPAELNTLHIQAMVGNPDPWVRHKGAFGIELATPAEVTVRHVGSHDLRNTPKCGPLFLEDVCLAPLRLDHPQDVWARQLDTEFVSPAVTNAGGRLWLLGHKVEGEITTIATTNGGQTELLGAKHRFIGPTDPKAPLFLVDDAKFTGMWWADQGWSTIVREKRGGATFEAGWEARPFHVGFDPAKAAK